MKINIKKSLQSLLFVPALALGVSMVVPVVDGGQAVYAQEVECDTESGLSLSGGVKCAKGDDQSTSLFGEGGIFTTIVNTLLFIIGAVSVIMIIFGGFRYVTSGGDSGGVSNAKNTILYAVVGLIVAILGYALVNFVITSFVNTEG